MAQKYSDERILEALLTAGSARQAAAALGCSLSCVRDRMSKSNFRAKYEEAKSAALGEAVDCMKIRMSSAVDVLSVTMTKEDTPATVKVSAADAILRHGLRYVEQYDIIKRIEALEAKQEENR